VTVSLHSMDNRVEIAEQLICVLNNQCILFQEKSRFTRDFPFI
jgi:hypothetical protein